MVLRQMAIHLGLPNQEVLELEDGLERFRKSHLFQALEQAERCYFEREFLLPWPRKRPPRGLRRRPLVRGVMDVVYCGGRNNWGIVSLTAAAGAAPVEQCPGLLFWVHAAHEQFGAWPAVVASWHLPSGSSVQTDGDWWRKSDLLDRFHKALSQRATRG
jgi:hypothetical protein